MEATVTYKKKIIDLKEDTFKSLSVLTSSLKKTQYYNLLINNIL